MIIGLAKLEELMVQARPLDIKKDRFKNCAITLYIYEVVNMQS